MFPSIYKNISMIMPLFKRVKARYKNELLIRNFTILGIETSCDDTGIAIVNEKAEIIGEAINSQELIHLRHGGIMPPVARDLHEENIQKVMDNALENAQMKMEDVDAIATTVKPGLPLSLLVGMKYGKELSKLHNKPFIPIHHMEAHALTIRMVQDIQFPFLVFLISGGHCLLSLVEDVDKFFTLGESIDHAPGEVFDKFARRLKLTNMSEFRTMSGGKAIDLASRRGDPTKFQFPHSMSRYRDCNFSFSGLKTKAQKYLFELEKTHGIEGDGIVPEVYDLSASFQLCVTQHLCRRLQRAMYFVGRSKLLPEHRQTLVVSGGVACNSFIKKMLQHVCNELDFELAVPPPKLCTDNGVMIAWNGVERWRRKTGVVGPDGLHTIDIEPKCKLGVSLIDDVRRADISCKWIKLPVK